MSAQNANSHKDDAPFVLIVDDNKGIVVTLEAWLAEAGYRARSASNGALAYEKIRDSACQCVLLDMEMPGFSGTKFLILLQAENITVPVVIITGCEDFEEKEMKQFKNVRALFLKPVSRACLLETVNALVRPGQR